MIAKKEALPNFEKKEKHLNDISKCIHQKIGAGGSSNSSNRGINRWAAAYQLVENPFDCPVEVILEGGFELRGVALEVCPDLLQTKICLREKERQGINANVSLWCKTAGIAS